MSFFKFFQKPAASEEAAVSVQDAEAENEVTPEKLERSRLFEQLRKAVQRTVGYAADGSIITNDIDSEVGLTEALGAVLRHKMKGFRANRLLSVSVLLEMGLEALPPTIKVPPFGKELRDSSLSVKDQAWVMYCLNNHVMYATTDVIVREFAGDSYEEAGILSYPETSTMVLDLIAPLDNFDFELSVKYTQNEEASAPSTPLRHNNQAAHDAPNVGSPKPRTRSANSHSMSSLPTEENGIVVAKTKKVKKKVRPAQPAPLADNEAEMKKKDETIAALEKQVDELKAENAAQREKIAEQQSEIEQLKSKIAGMETATQYKRQLEPETPEEKEEARLVDESKFIKAVSPEVKEEVNAARDVKVHEEQKPAVAAVTEVVPSVVAESEEEKDDKEGNDDTHTEKKEAYNTFNDYNNNNNNNNLNEGSNDDSTASTIAPATFPASEPVEQSKSVVAAVPEPTGNSLSASQSGLEDDDGFVILPKDVSTFKNGTVVDKRYERVVTKISVRADKNVQFISFEFSDGKIVSQGTPTGNELSITLKPGQCVNAIYGRKTLISLERLLIKFNTGEPFGPFGSKDGPDTFAFYAEENEYLYDIQISKSKKLLSQDIGSVVPIWKEVSSTN